jgi:D-alanyl-D-alanine carboxypeptidase
MDIPLSPSVSKPIRPAVFIFLVVILGAVAASFYFMARPIVRPYDLWVSLSPTSTPQLMRPDGIPVAFTADELKRVKQNFIIQQANFIEADLSTLILRSYHGGAVTKEVPILSIGKKGSWWETSAGLYSVETKERRHFSSFGHTYMPYSMQFQGNYFIHGWPYYPDGREVAPGYSGGCIRLSTADAQQIFSLAEVGMPLVVFGEDTAGDALRYQVKPPQINARSYFVEDIGSSFVLLEKDAETVRPMASIAKLMTALVATEHIALDKTVTITPSMLATTSLPRLAAGDRYTVLDLFYPLLEESSNEAARAIAASYYNGAPRFVELMNQRAQSLRLEHMAFVDPSGSADGNVSTAAELASFAQYLYLNKSFLLKVSSGKVGQNFYGATPFANLKNLNVFSAMPEFIGGKIGKTADAGETMLAVFNLPFGDTTRPVAIVILGSESVETDITRILQYLTGFYEPAS